MEEKRKYCPHCDKSYADSKGLSRHTKSCHSDVAEECGIPSVVLGR